MDARELSNARLEHLIHNARRFLDSGLAADPETGPPGT